MSGRSSGRRRLRGWLRAIRRALAWAGSRRGVVRSSGRGPRAAGRIEAGHTPATDGGSPGSVAAWRTEGGRRAEPRGRSGARGPRGEAQRTPPSLERELELECVEPEVGHLVVDFVGGRLGPSERRLFEAHLGACACCAEEEPGMRRLLGAIVEIGGRTAGGAVRDRGGEGGEHWNGDGHADGEGGEGGGQEGEGIEAAHRKEAAAVAARHSRALRGAGARGMALAARRGAALALLAVASFAAGAVWQRGRQAPVESELAVLARRVAALEHERPRAALSSWADARADGGAHVPSGDVSGGSRAGSAPAFVHLRIPVPPNI